MALIVGLDSMLLVITEQEIRTKKLSSEKTIDKRFLIDNMYCSNPNVINFVLIVNLVIQMN